VPNQQLLIVDIPPHVARYVESIDTKWQKHHPQNPDLLCDALERAYELFAEHPDIGTDVVSHTYSNLQVWHMEKEFKHNIFYRVVMNAENQPKMISIVRIWSTHKGDNPPFLND